MSRRHAYRGVLTALRKHEGKHCGPLVRPVSASCFVTLRTVMDAPLLPLKFFGLHRQSSPNPMNRLLMLPLLLLAALSLPDSAHAQKRDTNRTPVQLLPSCRRKIVDL